MTPNKNTPTKKTGNRQSIIIGIIAIIIIAIVAYAVIKQSMTPSQESNPITTASPVPSASPTPVASSSSSNNGTKVLLHTTAGDITIQLRTDKPITTANFVNIVQKGWYDGTTFYRTIADFMIQGGKISQTVPSIQDEIGTNNHNVNYTIAMAKTSQPNSATSEFFINAADNSKITYSDGTTFDGTYTVFGTVISGQSVVDTIANAPVTTNASHEKSQPINPVTLIKASIIS
jgi:peptidyl-prolyl cis-trans isomerase B (cyclophilin B)